MYVLYTCMSLLLFGKEEEAVSSSDASLMHGMGKSRIGSAYIIA